MKLKGYMPAVKTNDVLTNHKEENPLPAVGGRAFFLQKNKEDYHG